MRDATVVVPLPPRMHRRLRLRPTLYWSSLPLNLPLRTRFELALEAGFEGIDGQTVTDEEESAAIAETATAMGITIPSVVNLGSLRFELFSEDRNEVELAVGSILTTLDNARAWGAGAIHVIPAYLKGGVPYEEAYRRAQQVIRERILPVAEDYGIVCGIENAWRSIVQGPLEYVRFIDELDSPYVKAFIDTGNMIFGHTADWIRLAGDRVVRLHVKDFRMVSCGRFAWRRCGSYSFGLLGQGDVAWNAVSNALVDIGYDGWATCAELSPALPARALNKACAALSRHRLDRLPSAGWALSRIQRVVALRSLKDAAERLDRLVR